MKRVAKSDSGCRHIQRWNLSWSTRINFAALMLGKGVKTSSFLDTENLQSGNTSPVSLLTWVSEERGSACISAICMNWTVLGKALTFFLLPVISFSVKITVFPQPTLSGSLG